MIPEPTFDRVAIVTGGGGKSRPRNRASIGSLGGCSCSGGPKLLGAARDVETEIVAAAGQALAIQVDVTNPESVERMVASTIPVSGTSII